MKILLCGKLNHCSVAHKDIWGEENSNKSRKGIRKKRQKNNVTPRKKSVGRQRMKSPERRRVKSREKDECGEMQHRGRSSVRSGSRNGRSSVWCELAVSCDGRAGNYSETKKPNAPAAIYKLL